MSSAPNKVVTAGHEFRAQRHDGSWTEWRLATSDIWLSHEFVTYEFRQPEPKSDDR